MIAAWNRLFSIFQNRASKTSFNTPNSRLWSKYTHCAASPISAELLKKVGECRNPSLEENALPVSEQLPGAFQLEFKCWLSVELFQWSFSSGAFPVGLFQWLIFLWLLAWRCPKGSHYWSTSVSCGAFLITWDYHHRIYLMGWWNDVSPARDEVLLLRIQVEDAPGSQCGASLQVAPSVPPSWWRITTDSQLSSAGKHLENLDKPAQRHYCNMCLDFLKIWKSSEGWKHNQHHTARCTSYFWCIHPHCSRENNISASELWSGASMWC